MNTILTHTVLLKPGLVVYEVFNGYWYWGRPTPEEIRLDFWSISQKCRPDWDLTASRTREKWEAGQKVFFTHTKARRMIGHESLKRLLLTRYRKNVKLAPTPKLREMIFTTV